MSAMFQALTMDERVAFETMMNEAHTDTIAARTDNWHDHLRTLRTASPEVGTEVDRVYAQMLAEQTQIMMDLRNSVPECADGS